MTTPTDDQPAAAAKKARADHETAREIAARLLAPPDPVDILAGVIADHGEVADERDELQAKCDALTADLVAIRGMVCRSEVPIVEAVRRYCDDDREVKNELRRQRDDASRWIGQIAVALGLSEYAPAVAVRDLAKDVRGAVARLTAERDMLQARINDMATSAEGRDRMIHDLTRDRDAIRAARKDATEEVERLSALLKAAEADAKTQRTAAADLRNALDRVATAAGFGPDGAAPDIADRVVDVIRRLSSDRDQMRVAREDAAEDLERLDAILSSAGIDTTGPASDVADRVAAALLRPALPADLRTYLETRRDRLQGGHGLGLAAEIAALNRWLALPTAEVTK